MRPLIVLALVACSGGRPTPSPSTPSASEDSAASTADTSSTDTATSTTETGATSTGSTGSTGDTASGCGPDCFFEPDEGICVFPESTRVRSPMTDDLVDQRVDTCGPVAVVVCDTGALGYAQWLGNETPTFEVYDATTRAWVAGFEEEDGGDVSEACGSRAYYGDPDQIPCLQELRAWVYDVYNRSACAIWDQQTLGGKPDPCDNDPAVCIRDEWPR